LVKITHASVPVRVPTIRELREKHEDFCKGHDKVVKAYEAVIEKVKVAFRDLKNPNTADAADTVGDWLKVFCVPYISAFNQQKATRQVIEPNLRTADQSSVINIFKTLHKELKDTCTAKALHPLAPEFFPMWDEKIAAAYGVARNEHGYFLFLWLVRQQLKALKWKIRVARWLRCWRPGIPDLKVLDEYNYETYTKSNSPA